ncbi:hypothetical protein K7X08_008520 [Anisodus acutangulus]|uniref:Uncharacterized protein n=1 Tax=Anisodus acutangulus TaxID=402998 RepID=A0A9Q1MWC6_9SOLA|nr:hypothetical protein K7X08_008520 [Anisodus acutangulus]
MIGGSMELFMIKTGFYDKVTVHEAEKRAWENSPEAKARISSNSGIAFEGKLPSQSAFLNWLLVIFLMDVAEERVTSDCFISLVVTSLGM